MIQNKQAFLYVSIWPNIISVTEKNNQKEEHRYNTQSIQNDSFYMKDFFNILNLRTMILCSFNYWPITIKKLLMNFHKLFKFFFKAHCSMYCIVYHFSVTSVNTIQLGYMMSISYSCKDLKLVMSLP